MLINFIDLMLCIYAHEAIALASLTVDKSNIVTRVEEIIILK